MKIYRDLENSMLFDYTKHTHAELFLDCVFPWEVLILLPEYLRYILAEQQYYVNTDISRAAYIDKNVAIGEGTRIEPGVVIHGPTVIGARCVLRTNAYIRGNVLVGDDCLIGNSTEIKHSILLDHVTAAHFNYLGDSVIGNNVHFGAGVVLSNKKMSQREIFIQTLHGVLATGLQKFGAAIGDGVELGAHVVTNPGTIIGRDSVIYPQANIRGVIPSHIILKVRQEYEIVMKQL